MAEALIRQRVLDDGAVIVELRGELDIAINDALRQLLVDIVTFRRPPHIASFVERQLRMTDTYDMLASPH